MGTVNNERICQSKGGVYNGKFETLRDCETPVSKFLKQNRESETQNHPKPDFETYLKPALEVSRSGFPRPTYLEQPFYTPKRIYRIGLPSTNRT